MTRCESYPPCFGTIYFPTAPFFKTRRDFIGSKTESCMEFDSDAAGEEK